MQTHRREAGYLHELSEEGGGAVRIYNFRDYGEIGDMDARGWQCVQATGPLCHIWESPELGTIEDEADTSTSKVCDDYEDERIADMLRSEWGGQWQRKVVASCHLLTHG